VANPSFEATPYPTDAGVGLGAIPGWAGGSGVNTASGPFWNIGGAVDGAGPDGVTSTHAAFKQGYGLTGQPLSGFQVGETYWIQLYANARAGFDSCDVSVFEAASTVGGAPLNSPINITGPDPFTFINIPFTAAATSGDLNILNNPHTGGDNALVMDGFSVIRRATNDIVIRIRALKRPGPSASEVSVRLASSPAGPTPAAPVRPLSVSGDSLPRQRAKCHQMAIMCSSSKVSALAARRCMA